MYVIPVPTAKCFGFIFCEKTFFSARMVVRAIRYVFFKFQIMGATWVREFGTYLAAVWYVFLRLDEI